MIQGGDIIQIKNAAKSGKFSHVYLCRATDDRTRAVACNSDPKKFSDKFQQIVEMIECDLLPAGQYFVKFKTYYTGKPTAEFPLFIGSGQRATEPIAENYQQTETMDREEEMKMREELVKLRMENDNLKKELEEGLDEEPAGVDTVATLAESIKGILSEVVVPIISKYMEQRERRTVALEAAAASQAVTRPPAQIAPAQTFQVRSGYMAPQRPPAPYVAPATAAPTQTGGGGSQAQVSPEMTESEYIEALKHLTFDELVQQYELIKKTGKKIDLSFFLAAVREARPNDLVELIDQDLNPQRDETGL